MDTEAPDRSESAGDTDRGVFLTMGAILRRAKYTSRSVMDESGIGMSLDGSPIQAGGWKTVVCPSHRLIALANSLVKSG
jgi:hypothetical protein